MSCLILSYWYFCAVNAARGPLAGLSTAVRRVIGMIHLVNSLGTSWTVRSAKLMYREEKKIVDFFDLPVYFL